MVEVNNLSLKNLPLMYHQLAQHAFLVEVSIFMGPYEMCKNIKVIFPREKYHLRLCFLDLRFRH